MDDMPSNVKKSLDAMLARGTYSSLTISTSFMVSSAWATSLAISFASFWSVSRVWINLLF